MGPLIRKCWWESSTWLAATPLWDLCRHTCGLTRPLDIHSERHTLTWIPGWPGSFRRLWLRRRRGNLRRCENNYLWSLHSPPGRLYLVYLFVLPLHRAQPKRRCMYVCMRSWQLLVPVNRVYLFPIAIGLGGLVVLNKLIVHELQGEGRFTNTAAAHHDDLVERRAGRRFLAHGDGTC